MTTSVETRPGSQADLAPVLVAIVERHGLALLDQRARLHGLLRDYAPTALREIRLLLTAFNSGAPARLQSAHDPAEARLCADEATRMADDFGCSPEAAQAAVATWGRALTTLRTPQAERLASLPHSLPPVGTQPAAIQPLGLASAVAEEERPTWFGRFGGAIVGILLVLAAILRWLGVL